MRGLDEEANMIDKSSNEPRIASPAQIAGLEHASKQFSKQLHERWSARSAEWLARAEIQAKVNEALLKLPQTEDRELRSLFEAAQKLRSTRVEADKILRRPGLDRHKELLARANCNCSSANSRQEHIGPRRHLTPRVEVCTEYTSGSVTQFNMGWEVGAGGPFLSLNGSNWSSFMNLNEFADTDNKSTQSGRVMLGFILTPPINGFLSFSGAGSTSWTYSLDCQYAMAEVDAHIGTSVWVLAPQTGAIVNQWDSGDQQAFGTQSNFTNQSQSNESPFTVICASNNLTSCQGFHVEAGTNYLLWIYFELNAFQGAGATQANFLASFAVALADWSVFLQSIDWTLWLPIVP
jgi:hypothetical protein